MYFPIQNLLLKIHLNQKFHYFLMYRLYPMFLKYLRYP